MADQAQTLRRMMGGEPAARLSGARLERGWLARELRRVQSGRNGAVLVGLCEFDARGMVADLIPKMAELLADRSEHVAVLNSEGSIVFSRANRVAQAGPPIFLVDVSEGSEDLSPSLALTLLVLGPQRRDLVEGHHFIRRVQKVCPQRRFGLLAVEVEGAREAWRLHQELSAILRQDLDGEIEYFGHIPSSRRSGILLKSKEPVPHGQCVELLAKRIGEFAARRGEE